MATTAPLPLDVRAMNWIARALWVAAALLVLGAVAWWGVRHPAWTLRGVTVLGDVEHQNAVTFRAQLMSRLSGGFLTADLQQVREIFEGMPWVRSAVVQRTFPNRLTVTLEEHQPVAWWGTAGGGRLVNQYGELFEANPDDLQADTWAELAGPDDQSGRVHELYGRLSPILQRLDRDIQRLELSGRGSWAVVLDNGARIEIGRGTADELAARVQTFAASVTSLTQRYGGRDVESADLRYPDGYAVRLRGVTTLLQPNPAGIPPTPASPTTGAAAPTPR